MCKRPVFLWLPGACENFCWLMDPWAKHIPRSRNGTFKCRMDKELFMIPYKQVKNVWQCTDISSLVIPTRYPTERKLSLPYWKSIIFILVLIVSKVEVEGNRLVAKCILHESNVFYMNWDLDASSVLYMWMYEEVGRKLTSTFRARQTRLVSNFTTVPRLVSILN